MAKPTFQKSLVSLPQATFHQVEHLFDSPLTFQEYAEHLDQNLQQLLWLRSLFISIQASNSDEQQGQIKYLSLMGGHLVETWMNNINTRQSQLDNFYSRSQMSI